MVQAFLVRPERHVNDHQRVFKAAADRLSMHDHHVERDGKGGGQSMQHHADPIADQNPCRSADRQVWQSVSCKR
ncbi:hypothetical protein MESS4_p50004 [Mesorhizobium sp. STM 4661]|nr:hypothetical protein MESS4_p50004 [Mesorhizobium sp. STM 4661]